MFRNLERKKRRCVGYSVVGRGCNFEVMRPVVGKPTKCAGSGLNVGFGPHAAGVYAGEVLHWNQPIGHEFTVQRTS